ncbi:helix-turn-helix transcriptional regulator [Burkholderia territorii]|uniref:helix-turn-helix transcriptional regulator n=1 Tax=Burkholderia territorii TaxID=1503055 RepID=UPI00076D2635|nr:transcriptional regulator [Burkholderia territorii]KWA06630.1 transcriptional regulator [Burkholderia territorii]
MTRDQSAQNEALLPAIGLSTWRQIAPYLPIGRETWRKLCIAGKAPKPIRLSEKCTVYSNAEVHRWLADPLGYRADPDLGEAA